ncbi:hypothetical protein GCM10010468_63970 [Actinocorallia longicatena]|uniref:Uncharacterized protein n=1 Tax=Actinocorallia longicatena TaxID=111803 RepID=A0ABP6QI00_9ACTN
MQPQNVALQGHGGLTGEQPVFRAPAVPAAREAEGVELGELDEGPGVAQYAGVDMSGPAEPPKAGIPSSGNWQMPEWMREETEANRRAGGPVGGGGFDEGEMKKDRSRTFLFAGIGVLALGLFVGLAVVVLGGDDGAKDEGATPSKVQPADSPSPEPADTVDVPSPPDKALVKFKGTASPVVGTVTDALSGLVYPKFGGKWVVPTKQNKLGQSGWTGQQIMVTEHVGTQYWYGTILSSPLSPIERRVATEGDVKKTAIAASASLRTRLYAFRHATKPVASQEITVSGHKGWVVADYLTYKRPGIKATGEVVVTAVVDTGREVPAVLFVSMPNTAKKSWPDINAVLTKMKIAS